MTILLIMSTFSLALINPWLTRDWWVVTLGCILGLIRPTPGHPSQDIFSMSTRHGTWNVRTLHNAHHHNDFSKKKCLRIMKHNEYSLLLTSSCDCCVSHNIKKLNISCFRLSLHFAVTVHRMKSIVDKRIRIFKG